MTYVITLLLGMAVLVPAGVAIVVALVIIFKEDRVIIYIFIGVVTWITLLVLFMTRIQEGAELVSITLWIK